MTKRDVQHEQFDRTAITSDYFPNHNQTGSMLSMTELNSNSVLVSEQSLIMIAVFCLRWEKMCCVFEECLFDTAKTHPLSGSEISNEITDLFSRFEMIGPEWHPFV